MSKSIYPVLPVMIVDDETHVLCGFTLARRAARREESSMLAPS